MIAMEVGTPMIQREKRCAAVFKTYSWDSFVERQFRRFAKAAVGCDLFISVDETNGGVGLIPFESVVRFTKEELIAFGLPNRTEQGPLLWWNPDYAHYHFRHHYPDYDTYVFVEYDVVVSGQIAPIVEQVQATGTDLVSLPMQGTWFWSRFHHQTYEPSQLQPAVICFTVISARALDRLHDRRREMDAPDATRYWPSGEAFILTEVTLAGFRTASLAQFGDLSRYDWGPAQLECDVVASSGTRFQHPVLDERRYAANNLRTAGSVIHILDPRSDLRRRLRRIPRSVYVPLMPRAILTQLRVETRQRLGFARLWIMSRYRNVLDAGVLRLGRP